MAKQQQGERQFAISDDYKEVAERIDDLYEKFPNAVLEGDYRFDVYGDKGYIVYTAKCWRNPDDIRPCIGIAMEEIPGKTSFTRGSEIQNAETSAWGRAIVAAGASRSKKIASADEVRSAESRREADARDDEPAPQEYVDGFVNAMNNLQPDERRRHVKVDFAKLFGPPSKLTVGKIEAATKWIYEQIPELLDTETSTPDPAAAGEPDAAPEASPDGSEASGESSGSDAGNGGRVVGSSAAPVPASPEPEKPSTPQQRQTLGIRFKELVDNEFLPDNAKDELVGQLTGGRTTTRTELTFDEAVKLIALTHAIQAGHVGYVGGEVVISANNGQGDKFMEKWPNAVVPATTPIAEQEPEPEGVPE